MSALCKELIINLLKLTINETLLFGLSFLDGNNYGFIESRVTDLNDVCIFGT